jgi:GAF domain-containing protein
LLAGQAAVATQNLRSVAIAQERAAEAQQRSEQLGLVNRVVSAMVSSPDLGQVLDAVAGELLTAFNLAHAGIALLNADHTSLTVVAEQTTPQPPLSDSPGEAQPEASAVGTHIPVKGNPSTEQVLRTRRPLMIPDAQTSPLLAPLHVLIRQRGIQTMALFPIIAGGEVIGTIGLDTTEKGRAFTPEEMALAETLVGQISTSIQNANLYEQTQRALSETETLYNASAELNAAQTYDEILVILRRSTLLGHLHASNVTINLFDRPWLGADVPEWYIPIARWSIAPPEASPTARYPMSFWKTADQLLQPNAITVIEHADTDPRLDATARSVYVERMGASSLVFAPLYVGGQWIGHINSAYSQSTHFEEQDIRILMALVGQAAVTIQNLRLLAETRRRAAQLGTAAEIARDTSGTLALDTLLNRSVDLIRDRYGFYHASIFLLDEAGKHALVRASTGEAGQELIRRSHRLEVGSQSVIGAVTANGLPLVVNDVAQNPPPNLLPIPAGTGHPLKLAGGSRQPVPHHRRPRCSSRPGGCLHPR